MGSVEKSKRPNRTQNLLIALMDSRMIIFPLYTSISDAPVQYLTPVPLLPIFEDLQSHGTFVDLVPRGANFGVRPIPKCGYLYA